MTTTHTLPEGHRIASNDEAGWFYHGLWITDAPAKEAVAAPAPAPQPAALSMKDIAIGMLVTVNDETARNPGGYGRVTARSPKHGQAHVDSGEFPGQEVTGWYLIENLLSYTPPATPPTTQPAVTKRIGYNKANRDYDCYVAIDGAEEYIGSAPTFHDGELRCDAYAFERYSEHTPEVAAAQLLREVEEEKRHEQFAADQGLAWSAEHTGRTRIECYPVEPTVVLDPPPCDNCDDRGGCPECDPFQAALDPEPAPPIDDDIEDNFGGFRAIRRVIAGWDGKNHPDLAVIAAQILLPLAHLRPTLNARGDYLLVSRREEIPTPSEDYAILCDLIDALNEVAAQLPVRPDGINATLHIGGDDLYTVGHNGPPRRRVAVGVWTAEDQVYMDALDKVGPWPGSKVTEGPAAQPPAPLHPVQALKLALERGVFGLETTLAALRASYEAAAPTTECAICNTVQPCYDDGEAYICVDRSSCKARCQVADEAEPREEHEPPIRARGPGASLFWGV